MQYLLINQVSPLHHYKAQEILDLALALSTFDQIVHILFIDNALLQLLQHQQPTINYRKNFVKTFKALPMYDINNVYVDADSLTKLGLHQHDLIIEVNVVDKEKIVKLMNTVDIVLNI